MKYKYLHQITAFISATLFTTLSFSDFLDDGIEEYSKDCVTVRIVNQPLFGLSEGRYYLDGANNNQLRQLISETTPNDATPRTIILFSQVNLELGEQDRFMDKGVFNAAFKDHFPTDPSKWPLGAEKIRQLIAQHRLVSEELPAEETPAFIQTTAVSVENPAFNQTISKLSPAPCMLVYPDDHTLLSTEIAKHANTRLWIGYTPTQPIYHEANFTRPQQHNPYLVALENIIATIARQEELRDVHIVFPAFHIVSIYKVIGENSIKQFFYMLEDAIQKRSGTHHLRNLTITFGMPSDARPCKFQVQHKALVAQMAHSELVEKGWDKLPAPSDKQRTEDEQKLAQLKQTIAEEEEFLSTHEKSVDNKVAETSDAVQSIVQQIRSLEASHKKKQASIDAARAKFETAQRTREGLEKQLADAKNIQERHENTLHNLEDEQSKQKKDSPLKKLQDQKMKFEADANKHKVRQTNMAERKQKLSKMKNDAEQLKVKLGTTNDV